MGIFVDTDVLAYWQVSPFTSFRILPVLVLLAVRTGSVPNPIIFHFLKILSTQSRLQEVA